MPFAEPVHAHLLYRLRDSCCQERSLHMPVKLLLLMALPGLV
jgi:hypothetical protein